MKNLESVFVAYMIGWAVFFLFSLTVAKRSSSLRAEVERLKSIVTKGK